MLNKLKFSNFHDLFFSSKSRNIIENIILYIAFFSFVLHLLLVQVSQHNIFGFNISSDLLDNSLIAIYTPFSFILIYEVYLLVYYLPQSFTFYLSKQYEIITLIVLRRFFKDISYFDSTHITFEYIIRSQIFYDLIAAILLFFIVYLFKLNVVSNKDSKLINENNGLHRFITQKEIIASFLIPVFFLMALHSLYSWLLGYIDSDSIEITNLNHIFFEEFFNILIFVDILILLLSFFYKQSFHKIIRNSGFIITTIIIRISFSVSGILNLTLIISALLIGLCVLFIHNLFEKIDYGVKSFD